MALVARLVMNDQRSSTGRNLQWVEERAGTGALWLAKWRLNEKVDLSVKIPDNKDWILNELADLLDIRIEKEF